MKRLVCFLFGHLPAPGVVTRWCFRYHCERCGTLQNGGLRA